MNELGVSGKVLPKQLPTDSRNAIKPSVIRSYRSVSRVAGEAWLEDTRSGLPWSARGASLQERSGAELNVLRIWQEAPITADVVRRGIFEEEAPVNVVQGNYSLKLWKADGPRAVTISNVAFP